MSQNSLVKRQFGHRARLALLPAEALKADAQAHAARTMWNLLHAWWQTMPKGKRTLANADAAIRQARKDIDFLGVLPAQAAQAVLKTYLQAWKNCWDGRADAPNFKGRFRTVTSVDIPQGRDLNITRVHRRWGMVNIPKVGRVRFRWTKNLPVGKHAGAENRITGARLIKDALGWHIAFRVQALEAKPAPHQGPEVGIDVGVSVPLALSDGETYEHGEWLTSEEKARLLHWEQRAARRKQHRRPGERTSRRLRRTHDRIAGLRAKAKRRALDWQHKTTTHIARTYGTLVVEALTITNMVKSAKGTVEEPGKNVAQKSGLNRSIHAEAWGRTVTMLTYKTAQHGGTLHKAPAPGTSQRCSACGSTTPGNRESQAVFVCKNPDCGWSGNADHNAARNVLYLYRMGLALIPAAGRAVVRRARRVKPATAR
ncbi:Transposase [Streptomyces venezuelae]|uniref:RNA-guided endonuclease InsQ/TnpB family protein n=1 Tax=Streptomyces gardneri TaxID=66892 RepID=UPI0006BCDB77|nr:RNA-guided endonuclease TnpB family protein [Streptomyces gardneri]ALO11001.1 Transposase [Streptomyces venezuelae]QPK47947.1 transposase [Streptomyces gardneri]WRK39403.1 transposase [Streptomyces venezuelae]CUM38495.1 putative virulence protein [Streptomyces venezuelae]